MKQPDEYIISYVEKNKTYLTDEQITVLFNKIKSPKAALFWAQNIKTYTDKCYEICLKETEDQELIYDIAKFFNKNLDLFVGKLNDKYLKMKLIYSTNSGNTTNSTNSIKSTNSIYNPDLSKNSTPTNMCDCYNYKIYGLPIVTEIPFNSTEKCIKVTSSDVQWFFGGWETLIDQTNPILYNQNNCLLKTTYGCGISGSCRNHYYILSPKTKSYISTIECYNTENKDFDFYISYMNNYVLVNINAPNYPLTNIVRNNLNLGSTVSTNDAALKELY